MLLNKRNLIRIFLLVSIVLASCCNNDDSISEDNSNDNSAITTILDKWWYASICCTSDFYIHSDGRYEQRDSESNEITDTGNWICEDENLSIIKVNYDQGTGQTLSTVWFKYSEIQEHTIYVSYSEDGIDFFWVSYYQDTDI